MTYPKLLAGVSCSFIRHSTQLFPIIRNRGSVTCSSYCCQDIQRHICHYLDKDFECTLGLYSVQGMQHFGWNILLYLCRAPNPWPWFQQKWTFPFPRYLTETVQWFGQIRQFCITTQACNAFTEHCLAVTERSGRPQHPPLRSDGGQETNGDWSLLLGSFGPLWDWMGWHCNDCTYAGYVTVTVTLRYLW
jgi:hypothetical protein